MTNLKKFDASSVMKGVKDKIKATFVDLIPEEQWNEMIQKEIDDFFTYRPSGGYSRDKSYTSFESLVHGELKRECLERMKKYLDGKEFDVTWDKRGKPVVTESIKKMMIDNAGEILASIYGEMFHQMLNSFKSHLSQY